MFVCEFRFETFYAWGDDAYLDWFADRLEQLFQSGWTQPEISKDPVHRGYWQVCLFRGTNHCSTEANPVEG